jgi:AraC family transcriptional regulator, positive regulator of tynA and feaB
MEIFSTAGLPDSRKLRLWNERACDLFSQSEVRAPDPARFDGTLRKIQAGPLSIATINCSASRFRRTKQHIAHGSEPGYALIAPMHQEFMLKTEFGSEITVRTGDMFVMDMAHCHESINVADVRVLNVHVPRRIFEERVGGAQLGVERFLVRNSAVARILVGILQSLYKEITDTAVDDLPESFGHSLLEIIAASYQPIITSSDTRGSQERARRYRNYIDEHLMDCGLRPAVVASHFRVSERYLRMILKADGEPFSTYVLKQRLALSAARLCDPKSDHKTVMDIAFEVGFVNAAHFSEAFRAQFGVSPRQYRRGIAQEPLTTGIHTDLARALRSRH